MKPVPIQMTVLGKNLSGTPIESNPPSYTGNTYPHAVGTVVGNENHHRLRNAVASGDQVLHVTKKSHVLAIGSSDALAVS